MMMKLREAKMTMTMTIMFRMVILLIQSIEQPRETTNSEVTTIEEVLILKNVEEPNQLRDLMRVM